MADFIVLHSIKVAKDFTPETFGRLTTIGPKFLLPIGKQGYKKSFQVCQCSCGGGYRIVQTASLLRGITQSCGCLQKEKARQRCAEVNIKHGQTAGGRKSSTYVSYSSMKLRCLYASVNRYGDYGGRGITVCDRWLCPVNGFLNFLADMGPRPSPKHEIERKDVNGNYCPENCCWATREQQARNKRNNVNLTYKDKTQCLTAWAEELGISAGTLRSRILLGWDVERALATPVRGIKK